MLKIGLTKKTPEWLGTISKQSKIGRATISPSFLCNRASSLWEYNTNLLHSGGVMMITRAPEYTKIAKRLVSTLPEFEDIRNYKPKFIVLASDEEKQKNRKTVFGQCYKTSKTYEWICPYDFFIVVYETNCVGFNEKQMETLLRHELNHIGVGTEGNDISYYVRPHDYEEFKTIICECGLDWSR